MSGEREKGDCKKDGLTVSRPYGPGVVWEFTVQVVGASEVDARDRCASSMVGSG